MSWTTGNGVDTSIGLSVGCQESVALRLNKDGGAYLSIGDTVEALLAQPHVAALREQSAGVLADMRALQTAQDRATEAHRVGERAASTVEYARAQAAAALAVGATREGRAAHAAADRASDSAGLVHSAVRVVLDAIHSAEQAVEAAGEAAAAAARAAAAASRDADHRERVPGDPCPG